MIQSDINKVGILGYLNLDYAIGTLRRCNILLLKNLEEVKHDETEFHSLYMGFVKKLEDLLKIFESYQEKGDKAIALMTPEYRKRFNAETPGFFSMLGWKNKIDSNGKIIHDA